MQLKKYRKQEQCFVVEGRKSVLEVLASDFEVLQVLATYSFLTTNQQVIPSTIEVIQVSPAELESVSEYATNDAALAIVRMKPNKAPVIGDDEFVVMLDDLRDPGNLGTIIRTADWYGVSKIIASEETADCYNNKVIQASMGSFTRVSVYYTSLPSFLESVALPVYGTFLQGNDAHTEPFGKGGIIVIGNEANGISAAVEKLIKKRISIPRYGHAESLNAAIATAVILDNIRRKG